MARSTQLCLDLLERHQVRATFFVVGWVAERHPELVARIAAAGHEIGCHSYGHPLLYRLDDAAFLADLDRALAALRAAGVKNVAGYRAPSFSLTRPVHHFLPLLAQRGFQYDSSLFPIHHHRYGQPVAPRRPFLTGDGDAGLVVVPMTTARACGLNIPFSGGGYLRLLPLWAYRGLRRLARRQGVPVMIYLHPWELDGQRPEAPVGRLTRWRSQVGIESAAQKLEAILTRDSFTTLGDYVAGLRAAGAITKRDLPLW